jgi:hypothetical protein
MRKFLSGLAVVGVLLLYSATMAQGDFSEYRVEEAEASLSSYQAGAHADLTTAFKLNSELAGGGVAQTRDIVVALPPGLLGNLNAVPKCTMEELGQQPPESHCPVASQVGVNVLQLAGTSGTVTTPLYNMPAPGGNVVARFGFFGGPFPLTVNVRVRSDGDYGATAAVEGAAAQAGLRAARTTIWGVPASPSHDSERITPQEGTEGKAPAGGKRAAGIPPQPFLSNPTRCGVPLQVRISADSYQEPGSFSSEEVPLGTIIGCGKVDFKPSFSATPTSREAAAPTGLDIDVKMPQDETPEGRATSQLKDATVVFPEGMTIAPGAADGLEACSAAEAGYLSLSSGNCPAGSKLGTVELDVPALERPIEGGIYQRTPEPGHLFRVWIVADELGAHVALPGEIDLDEQTGRITSTFLDNPQVPVREIQLHIFGGPRAPLANPSACGTYQTRWQLVPWSGSSASAGTAPMTIDSGCGTGGFSPRLTAGTVSSGAGTFSPFVLELSRESGEQNVQRLEVTLPPGVLAKLGGVPLCEGSAAASGSCSSDSRIGSVSVAAGPGSSPLWIPQPGKAPTAIFLGGPYEGAPYSLVIQVPAQAGPFDLGTVTVRSAIRIEPETARVTAASDPLPQILKGVPISYRRIRALVDRQNFTLNATNCDQLRVKAQVMSIGGAVAEPTSPYQATNCAKLPYGPKLSIALKGGTARTQHPALQAVLKQPKDQANTAAATVIMPPSLFIDQAHISNPCTRVQFNANSCPSKSILGTVKAVTPLLDKPLVGKVYFRSNGGERELPDIVADLHGPIHVIVVGFVDAVHKKGSEISRTRTRFLSVPDAPVSKFTISLFGGKRGLLQNSRNLCTHKQRAKISLRGQNGRGQTGPLALKTSCR